MDRAVLPIIHDINITSIPLGVTGAAPVSATVSATGKKPKNQPCIKLEMGSVHTHTHTHKGI